MWSNKYLNIPFKQGGRDPEGLDCWGLARLVYKQEFNIELPSFASEYDSTDDRKLLHEVIAQYKEGWEQLSQPESGCMVLFRMFGTESHIGVMVNTTQFLHTRNKYTSAVENISGIEWKNRIVGYFKYRENTGVVMQTVPHPLRTQRIGVVVPPGTNLQEVYSLVNTEYKISGKIKKNTHIILNGRVIPESDWGTTIVVNSDTLEYRAVPTGNAVRMLLTLAVVIAVMVIAPEVALMAGAQGSVAYAAAYVATATAITMVGGALINAIAPIRPPEEKNLPDGTTISQTLINGGSNQLGRYSSIPVVLGKILVTPPLGAQNYSRFSGTPDSQGIVTNASISYLDMLLVWGYGPLQIDKTTMRIGKVPLVDFYGDGPDGKVRYSTLDRIAEPTADQLAYFNGIYGKDIQQISSGLALTGNSITIGPNTPLDQLPANTVLLDATTDPGANKATELRAQGKIVAYYGSTYQGLPPSPSHPVRGLFGVIPTGAIEGDWAPSQTPGPWISLALTQPCDKLTVALHFPQGLRITEIKGDGAGNLHPAPVVIDFEIKVGTGAWTHWTTQTIGGILNGLSSVTRNINMFGGTDEEGYPLPEFTRTITEPGFLITGGGYIKDAFTWTITKERNWDASAVVQVRVRRVTGDYDQPNDTWRFSHAVQLLSLTGYSNKAPAIDPPNTKIAKTALTIQATAQLNGRIEGINAVVQTYCKVWDGVSWDTVAATSNPAALFLYILTHSGNPQRVTQADIVDKIDFAKLSYWYEYCDQNRSITLNGSTYNYKFEYNDILGTQKSVLDVLRDICAAGRASPAMIDGKWSVTIDEPKNEIIQHFSPHNSWGFESIKGLPKLPDALKVQYIDENADYVTNELIVSYADKNVDTAELFESIQLPGVTNIGAAADHARWHLAQVKVRPEIYTLNCDIEHVVCNRGDRVKIAHDVPMWGLGSGRIKTRITDTIFELDEDLELKLGTTYILRVRGGTGNSRNISPSIKTQFIVSAINRTNNILTVSFNSTHPIQVGDSVKVNITGIAPATVVVTDTGTNYIKFTNAGVNLTTTTVNNSTVSLQDGYYSTVQLGSSMDISEANAGDLFLFGQNEQQFQDLIILAVEPGPNKSARLTLVDYGVNDQYDLYADYRTFTSDTIFKSKITVAPALLLNSIGTKMPVIDTAKITSDSAAMEQIGTGVYRYTIKVPFVNMGDLPATVESVQAEVKLTESKESAGISLFTSSVGSNSISINNVEVNKQYSIRLRYISKTGNVGQWTDIVVHTVLGKNANYQTVTSVGIVKSKRNLIITPKSDSLHSDFKCYEIRVWQNGGIGDFWTAVDPKIQRFATIDSISIDLRNFSSPRISHGGVQYRVACRALDTSGNYSPASAVNTITLKTIPA